MRSGAWNKLGEIGGCDGEDKGLKCEGDNQKELT